MNVLLAKKCFLCRLFQEGRKKSPFLAVNKVTNASQSGRKISFPTSLLRSPIFLQSNSCHRNPLRLFLCKSTGITRCASSHHHRVLICPIYPPLQELSTGKERTPLGTTPIKNMDTLHPDISLLNLRVHTNVSKAK